MRGHATPLMAMALAHWQRNGAADDAARAGGGDPAVGPAGFSAADPLLDPFTAFVAARVRAMGDTRASTLLLNVRGEERGGVRLSSTAPPSLPLLPQVNVLGIRLPRAQKAVLPLARFAADYTVARSKQQKAAAAAAAAAAASCAPGSEGDAASATASQPVPPLPLSASDAQQQQQQTGAPAPAAAKRGASSGRSASASAEQQRRRRRSAGVGPAPASPPSEPQWPGAASGGGGEGHIAAVEELA